MEFKNLGSASFFKPLNYMPKTVLIVLLFKYCHYRYAESAWAPQINTVIEDKELGNPQFPHCDALMSGLPTGMQKVSEQCSHLWLLSFPVLQWMKRTCIQGKYSTTEYIFIPVISLENKQIKPSQAANKLIKITCLP